MTSDAERLHVGCEHALELRRVRIVAVHTVAIGERCVRIRSVAHRPHVTVADPAQLVAREHELGPLALDRRLSDALDVTALGASGTRVRVERVQHDLEGKPLDEGACAVPELRGPLDHRLGLYASVRCVACGALLGREGGVDHLAVELRDEPGVTLEALKILDHPTTS